MQRSSFCNIFKHDHSIYQKKTMHSSSNALVSIIHILKMCTLLEGDGGKKGKGGLGDSLKLKKRWGLGQTNYP